MNNNLINQKILLWIKEGYTQKSIINRLEKEGVSNDISINLYKLVFKEYQDKKNKKTTIIWSSVGVIFLITHFFILPVNVLYNSAYLFNILIGLIIGISILQAICRFESVNDFFEILGQKNNEVDKSKKKQFPLIIILPILGIILTTAFYSLKINYEYKSHGKIVTGIILDGYSNTTKSIKRTTTTNEIMYRFQLNENKYIDGSSTVNSSFFNSVYKGMEIKIIYSTRFPQINKISMQ